MLLILAYCSAYVNSKASGNSLRLALPPLEIACGSGCVYGQKRTAF